MHQQSATEATELNLANSDNQTGPSKRVIFTMGGKGGVGKTSFVLALAEWFENHRIPIRLLAGC